MTGRQHPLAPRSSVFADDEPVLQSLPLLAGASSPTFGESTCWDFNGVLRRPASHLTGQWRLPFTDLSLGQNLLARELAMIEFNPRHPAVLTAGVHLPPTPRKVPTQRARGQVLRALAAFGATEDLPDDFGHWSVEDFHRYITQRRCITDDTAVRAHITVVKLLHQFAPVLTTGLPADPWPGQTGAKVLGLVREAKLRTAVVEPGTWFPLIHAAWTYVDVFGPDILRARAHWKKLQTTRRHLGAAQQRRRLDAWLADPESRVPVWHPDDPLRHPRATTPVNWALLTAMLGLGNTSNLFAPGTTAGRLARARVTEMVAAGRTQPGLLPALAAVERADGTRGPWRHSLHPPALWIEYTALRNAAFVLVVGLSMMRNIEVRDILKDSVVEYYGSPAVKATKHKLDPDLPVRHWWIIEPVAKAIATAAELSVDAEYAFASVQDKSPINHFDSSDAITCFVRHANNNRHVTGLPQIPEQKLAPHMFRRTMAMLTREFPGSEIAVGMQLKHVATRALANTTTQGYTEPSPAWAQHLRTAISERRFERLAELFAADGRGEPIGYGPGADRLRETFAAIRAKAAEMRATTQAQRGDLRVELDLLRRTRLSVRFGKLNHCTMDDANPVGARCLEDAIVPEGHHGPLIDRCQPSRCANSIIAPAHLPIWTAERASLTDLLATRKLPTNRRALLTEQLHEVDRVIRRNTP
ncbi:hypothetical protein [Streptomyces jeddahensis]|uniref:Phage integrase family protein n=1 Tax=Streptomyces jeddahensis TaxID=1716141 RepID=A0A177HSC7_9ACTN|nr:hypothetical protein [Streptomyces jeddahensis]OAH13499.1 hypothetical protein STSP_31770 [Streptomyces jeddahensis]